MTNTGENGAAPPSQSPSGLIRLRVPSLALANSTPQTHVAQETSSNLRPLEASLQQLIQSLLETAIMVHDLEEGTGELLFQKIDEFTMYLQEVQRTSANVTETIPEDVLAYVEDGLNPDKYTRRFVSVLTKDNQFVNGKIDAVQDFRDVLAEEIKKGFSDLEEYVDEVIKNTGGARKTNGQAKQEDHDSTQID